MLLWIKGRLRAAGRSLHMAFSCSRKRVAGVISQNGGFGGLHPRDQGNPTRAANNDKPEWFQPQPGYRRSARAFGSILKNLHFFESYEPTATRHHFIQRRQKAIDLVLAIDNLDHQGQVF